MPHIDDKPWLLPLLRKISIRPGAYLGAEDVRSLELFLTAYGQAREDLGLPKSVGSSLEPSHSVRGPTSSAENERSGIFAAQFVRPQLQGRSGSSARTSTRFARMRLGTRVFRAAEAPRDSHHFAIVAT
jgi:hypothetical protein